MTHKNTKNKKTQKTKKHENILIVILLTLIGQLFLFQFVYAQTSQNLICICDAAPEQSCQDQPDDLNQNQQNRQALCNQVCSNNVRQIITTGETCLQYCRINPTICNVQKSTDSQPKGCIPGVNCVQLQNPLGEGKERTDLRAIIGEVIKKVLTILGSITLLVFIAGGVMWLTSGGSEEKVAKGSKTMLYAAIGIAVIFAAYAILNTVIRTLTGT